MRDDSFDDEREKLDSPDDSSEVQVKNDDDYNLRGGRQNVQVIFYKSLVLKMGSK